MFELYTTKELIDYVKKFIWKRTVNQIHIHHTWQPDHADFNGTNGVQLCKSMYDYHTKTLGWSSIGQNLTLLPDGKWVVCRDFNANPASIEGWNTGAFAIEMIGDFDVGNDTFGGKQAEAIYEFCAFFVKHMNLIIDSIKFHRDSPTARKTCPGTSIDKQVFISNVQSQMNKPVHWADKYYDFLNDNGVKIHVKNYSDNITRGEVFALLARVMGIKE